MATLAPAPVVEPRPGILRLVPRRLGLRLRITLSFAVGAFLLSALFAFVTYAFTRAAILRQREHTAEVEAQRNSRQLVPVVNDSPNVVNNTLTGLGSGKLMWWRAGWLGNPEFTVASLPPALVMRVNEQRQAARMIYSSSGKTYIAVGLPLGQSTASYFEITLLGDTTRVLRTIGFSLLGASAITTSLGVLLGRWAANRAVRPLTEAAEAAKAIAGGRLDTRLDPDDDTGLKALSEAFNDMASKLQQRIERDTRFASDVSHELRSPLMTLSASIEVMNARREEMPERAVAALDLLSGDVVRFQGLVEDLLEISRFDAGAIRLHLEDVLAGEFVRQAVAASSVAQAEVVIVPEAEELVLRADKRRLARAVANLLDNARVYGGGDVTVTVDEPTEPSTPADRVWIAVEDRGPGVAPEERTLVFERFARGTGARRRGLGEGAGLGLALVDEHVRLHGGRVWVEDRADGEPGARFVIELPAEPL